MGFPVTWTFTSRGRHPHEYPAQYIARKVCVSKRTTSLILVVYLSIIWAAVIFRIDYFPLTWVPMYSVYEPSEIISTSIKDKAAIKKGFRVTHRDGSISYVSYKDLNMPKPNFGRLYNAIIFGHDPPKHKQGNTSLGLINRWIRGLDDNERNFSVDWEWRMFWTINKTLRLEPGDPQFITRIESSHQKRVYKKADLLKGDTHKVEIQTNTVVIDWQEQWIERWNHGLL